MTQRSALIAVFVGAGLAVLMQRMSPHYDPAVAARQAATSGAMLSMFIVFGGIARLFFGWHRRFHRRMALYGVAGLFSRQQRSE
jgi:hypothetical protein